MTTRSTAQMAMRYAFFATAVGVLAACGAPGDTAKDGQAAEEGTAPGVALVRAAADPCAEAGGPLSKALCQDPDLAPLAGTVRERLAQAASFVSEGAAKDFASAQEDWMEAVRVACSVTEAGAGLSEAQKQCVRAKLEERVQTAAKAARPLGGFTFQTVEINKAQVVPESFAAAVAPSGAPAAAVPGPAVETQIRFPRIDGDSPAIRKFNELMRQRPQTALTDQTSEYVDYAIAYAGPELVSVRFDRQDVSLGAIHPSNSTKAVTVVMGTGEPLAAEDVFAAPPERWRKTLVEKSRADLMRQITAMGASRQIPQPELEDTATKTRNWLITEDALVVIFPPESIGPHALGTLEVAIPWSELKPLLKPSGPGPIGEAARAG